ncbi:MBOAT family O-acyltransferase [Lysinibacillus sphaericus]
MVFSNLVFIFMFLPVVLFFYFIARKELKNFVLICASLVFYAWGEPKYVFLMLFSILLNYIFGLAIDYFKDQKLKKVMVALAVIGNLAILGYYKYINFLIDNLNQVFNLNINAESVPLPIGISFFTFQAISYIIDVYRKDTKVQKSFLDLTLYISLFPQLVAGPIVRYNTVAEQIKSRISTHAKVAEGIRRFIVGLSKKVLLANGFGEIADTIFAMNPSEMSIATAWLGIAAYTLQIYFDFSGYSDMAIGLGKMFGFDFEENFNFPYISKSIAEFWRRWHISLGTWFKDYVYIPLGGNRGSTFMTVRNLLIVWTITGFWHGASWTFMAWGFYYGFLIVLERLGLGKLLSRLWAPLQHAYVLILVMIGWVFFRADNFSYSFEFLQTMFGFNQHILTDTQAHITWNDNWYVFVLGIIFSTPVFVALNRWTLEKIGESKFMNTAYQGMKYAGYMIFMVLVTILLVNSTYNPFIYFRF